MITDFCRKSASQVKDIILTFFIYFGNLTSFLWLKHIICFWPVRTYYWSTIRFGTKAVFLRKSQNHFFDTILSVKIFYRLPLISIVLCQNGLNLYYLKSMIIQSSQESTSINILCYIEFLLKILIFQSLSMYIWIRFMHTSCRDTLKKHKLPQLA